MWQVGVASRWAKWANLNFASSISRTILSVTDSSWRSAVNISCSRGRRKSHETGAEGTADGTSSDSSSGEKALLVGVGGNSGTDDMEERDVEVREVAGEREADLPLVTSMNGSLTNSSKSPLLPSSESLSELSSTASIEKRSMFEKISFWKSAAFRPPQQVEMAAEVELRYWNELGIDNEMDVLVSAVTGASDAEG
jgi:hypothetical protein